jgi:hypothetical protein
MGGETAKASVFAAAGWFRLDSEARGGDFAFWHWQAPHAGQCRRDIKFKILDARSKRF